MKVFSSDLQIFIEPLMRYVVVLFLWTVSIHSLDQGASRSKDESCDSRTPDRPADLGNRLPKTVLPRKYVIAVCPDFERNIFHGAIQITCELLEVN